MSALPRKISNFRALLLVLLWFGVLGILTLQRQAILDYFKLRGYNPPAAVSQLASADTMTPKLRHIYYVNRPSIEDKTTFKTACPNGGGEQTIVLGCYHGGQNGIFLLDVTDGRLAGVEQVTAAHEALHAAYDRLSGQERRRIDAMLLDYYEHQLQDVRIKTTIDAYRQTEPNDLVNEMHSIFGTELADLPAPLETYYRQYFTNRSQVATYAAQYQAEFSSRQATLKQDDAQLKTLKSQIDAGEQNLQSMEAQITSSQQNLNQLRSRDPAAYNAAVPAYNAAVERYNQQVATIKSLIVQYNQLVASRNQVAAQIAELSQALSTDATSLPQ